MTTEAMATAPDKQRNPVKPLAPQSLVLEQHGNNSWVISAHAGSVPEDYDLKPGPFAVIAQQLTRFDTIKLIEAGGAWWAEALVVHVVPGEAMCKVLRHIDLKFDGLDQTDVPIGFEVRPAMPGDGQRGWVVIRRRDGVAMNAGVILGRREDAVRYIRGHNAA